MLFSRCSSLGAPGRVFLSWATLFTPRELDIAGRPLASVGFKRRSRRSVARDRTGLCSTVLGQRSRNADVHGSRLQRENQACLAGLKLLAQWLHRLRPGTVAGQPDLVDVWPWC